MAFAASSLAVLLLALACAHAVPVQGGVNMMRHDEYGPLPADLLTRYLEDRGIMEQRNLDGIGGGHLLRQTRRGLDSLSGGFGDGRRLPLRGVVSFSNHPGNLDEIDRSGFDRFAKRNIDEIDRSSFDSFFKRNFDEIDHAGWSGFVKRLSDYRADKQRL